MFAILELPNIYDFECNLPSEIIIIILIFYMVTFIPY